MPEGDVDLDGEVDLYDATYLFYYINGMRSLTGDALEAADINGDGRINLRDAARLFYKVNGLLDAPQTVKVVLDANGGTVELSSKTVNVSSTYGALPTPVKAYHTFTGWYTQQDGGVRVQSDTVVTDTQAHTLYARWSENAVSDWVLASQVPADAKVVSEKWTYTQLTSSWKETGSGTQYYASYPSGFDSSHSLYGAYQKSALSSYENATSKRVVSSASVHRYIYWHWCRGKHYGANVSNYNRKISTSYSAEFCAFHAFESTTAIAYDSSADAYWYVNQGACDDTCWWNCFTVYKQTYTDYTKVTTSTDHESSTQVTASGTVTNVQKWVRYQAK